MGVCQNELGQAAKRAVSEYNVTNGPEPTSGAMTNCRNLSSYDRASAPRTQLPIARAVRFQASLMSSRANASTSATESSLRVCTQSS
jgi:hypothetical protein